MYSPTTPDGQPGLRNKLNTLAAAPLLAVALAGAAPAQAQLADSWQYEASIYAWLPALSGDTSFPPNGGGPSLDVSSEDVIDALKMAFMGSFQARKGQWGLWTDLVYADLGGTKQGVRDISIGGQPLPAGVNSTLKLDLKALAWTLTGLYSLKSDEQVTTDLVFGARMLDVTTRLDWTFAGTGPGFLPPVTGTKEVSQTNWDAVVGLKGRFNLGTERKWFMPYYIDVGTGDSDLTWQANLGVGYKFDWGALVLSYRHLSYDLKSGGNINSLGFSGPLFGAAWQF